MIVKDLFFLSKLLLLHTFRYYIVNLYLLTTNLYWSATVLEHLLYNAVAIQLLIQQLSNVSSLQQLY